MVPLILLSTLTGAALGLRFKVYVLIAAIVPVAVVTLAAWIGHGDGRGSLVLEMAATITALQLGYFGGMVVRFTFSGTRLPVDQRRLFTSGHNKTAA